MRLPADACLWFLSPALQTRISSISNELTRYEAGDVDFNSAAQRLEFWKKSLRFIADAPMLGHGTGSIGSLFAKDSVGKSGAAALTIANPHNQILHSGIQWGLFGIALLVAMWIAHLRVFAAAGTACWIGLLVVSQNILGSLFNSHLADFVEGWLYVMGAGVAAGMVRGQQLRQMPASVLDRAAGISG